MRPLLLGCLLAAALASAALALALDEPGSQDLLTNGDFEDGISGWQWLGGALTTTGDPFGKDNVGAVILTSSIAFISQPVSVLPGGSVRFTGTYVARAGDVAWVQPSLEVYDANGGLLGSFGIEPVAIPGAWSFDVLAISCAAATAQVRVGVHGASGAVAYLDDLRLKASPPSTPCPSPTPTASATETVMPTATPTATAQAVASPTHTATPTRTPSPTSAATPTVTPTLTPSHGLVINGGFEVGEGGVPLAWRTFGGELTYVEAPVHGGSFAGCFSSATSSTKWVYQTVPVAPEAWYEFQAYVYHDDPQVEAAWLRISWYTSTDGSGTAVATVDSTEVLVEPQPVYRYLSTGPVQAPSGAHSANVRILLRPRSAATASIYIDDVSFSPTGAPLPTPTATPSPQPSATATPSAVPSPTLTPSAQPQATSTPTPSGSAQATPTPLRSTPTLSPRPTSTPTPTGSPPPPSPTPEVLAPTHGLLVNGGFELADEEGKPLAWERFGGSLAQVDGPVWSGQSAGSFSSASDSTKWVYQTVGVDPGAWYELDGYVYHNDPQVAGVLLRISWYDSTDGSGTAAGTADSAEELAEPQPSYRYLTTGPVQAPPSARSAKARVLLRPRSEASAIIYIDEVSLRPSAPPPVEPEGGGSTGDGADSGAGPRTGGSSTGRPSSEALGVSRGPLVFTPQPTPVIRRSELRVPEEELPSSQGGESWWPWALAAGAAVAATAGWGVWWWERRRPYEGAS